jgi:hypothetical protein
MDAGKDEQGTGKAITRWQMNSSDIIIRGAPYCSRLVFIFLGG